MSKWIQKEKTKGIVINIKNHIVMWRHIRCVARYLITVSLINGGKYGLCWNLVNRSFGQALGKKVDCFKALCINENVRLENLVVTLHLHTASVELAANIISNWSWHHHLLQTNTNQDCEQSPSTSKWQSQITNWHVNQTTEHDCIHAQGPLATLRCTLLP